eukprot:537813_1
MQLLHLKDVESIDRQNELKRKDEIDKLKEKLQKQQQQIDELQQKIADMNDEKQAQMHLQHFQRQLVENQLTEIKQKYDNLFAAHAEQNNIIQDWKAKYTRLENYFAQFNINNSNNSQHECRIMVPNNYESNPDSFNTIINSTSFHTMFMAELSLYKNEYDEISKLNNQTILGMEQIIDEVANNQFTYHFIMDENNKNTTNIRESITYYPNNSQSYNHADNNEENERIIHAREIEFQEKQKYFEEKNREKKEKDNHAKAVKKIARQIQIFQDEASAIKRELEKMNLKNRPLHKFNPEDVSNTIKCWIYNDISYSKHLEKIMNIFVKHNLNEKTIRQSLTTDDVKFMIKDDLLTFLSAQTFHIMFNEFDEWIKQNNTTNLSSVEIGYEIYHLPLNKLVKKIIDEEINGERFENYCQTDANFIETHTGWDKDEIYQIEAQLWANKTYKKHEFIDNMQLCVKETCLSMTTVKCIENTILKFENDLESIHLNIKHGKRNQEFNEAIINMVNDLSDQNDIEIYKLIASCFMWNECRIQTDVNKAMFRKYQWNCYNCGNVNFCAFVDSKINNDLQKCALCGITQTAAIMYNLRNHNTFIMKPNDAETKNDNYSIDEMIKDVILTNDFDLTCTNRNNNDSCPSIIRLAKYLIQYNDDGKKTYKITNVNVSDDIQNHYNHILNHHIYHGNNQTKRNTFMFFKMVVHYNDRDICNSNKRHQVTTQQNNLNKLKSNNIQNEFDVMHSFLVHSNVIEMMKDSVSEFKHELHHDFDEDKYVSYSFGVQHKHPHLLHLFDCIRYELLYNSAVPLGDKTFQDSLIKAIDKRKYVLKGCGDTLLCKYFDAEYNIIRNEQIGIRHILSVIVYTDLSEFCTAFRSTYRRKDAYEDAFGMTERHTQWYWFARTLFECIEFFGHEMQENIKVYHGLESPLQFKEFAAYFNQPKINEPQQFASVSSGTGITLTLKPRSNNKFPRYLSVSWLSISAHKELLFYGKNVCFKIVNITGTGKKNGGHQNELAAFNKFQSTLQNEDVKWNKNEIANLVKLIRYEIQSRNNEHETEENALFTDTYITDYAYGRELFHDCCFKMTHISIKNFRK